MGDSVSGIGESCFQSCGIKNITIPQVCDVINNSAFYDCNELQSFVFQPKNKMKVISSYLFWNCKQLTSFVFPDYVETIESYAFSNTGIEIVQLPVQLSKIQRYAFQDCTNLKTFIIPKDSLLSEFEFGVFSGCLSFEEIKNSCDNFVIWNKGLFNAAKTELIVLPPASGIKYFSFPETVTTLGYSALESCYSLEVVFIPYSVQIIRPYAFRYCKNLRSINLPNTVTTIGTDAFDGCKSLQCGLSIENRTSSFKDSLIHTSKLLRKCFIDCKEYYDKGDSSSQKALIDMCFIFLLNYEK